MCDAFYSSLSYFWFNPSSSQHLSSLHASAAHGPCCMCVDVTAEQLDRCSDGAFRFVHLNARHWDFHARNDKCIMKPGVMKKVFSERS